MPDPADQSFAASWLRTAPRWSLIAVSAVIGVYLLLVAGAVHGRGALWHDEAVSVLHATGHADDWNRFEFEGAAPYGEWATVGDFQAVQAVDRPLDLVEVARNVGQYDVHPPGFFWLEHLALLGGVPTLWAGPLVNGLLGAVLGLLAFGLMLRLTADAPASVAVSAAVLWSPAMLLAAGEARQYVLYAMLLLALTAWGAISLDGIDGTDRLSPRRLWGLGAVVAIGLLSSHQFFANVVIAVALVSLLILPRWRIVAQIALASLGGAVAAWTIFPYFFAHLGRLGGWTPGFESGLVVSRALRWLDGLLDMVTLSDRLQGPGHAVIRVLAATAFVVLVARARAAWRWVSANRAVGFVVLFAVGSTAVPAAAYAAQRFLAFVEGGHYVAPLWPLIVVGGALVTVTVWPRRGAVAVVVLAAGLLVSSAVWVASLSPHGNATRSLIGTVASGDALIVDCVSRGYFPTITESLDPDTPVFAARGEDVVALLDSGWESSPSAVTYLLHAACADGPDVLQAIRASGHGDPIWVGNLERLQVWRLPQS